ncbi:MBL fold metallo-hydrolase [candidate division CSSED10-310 bacterium]|uniref:MBL fold metallo-hydrolase n=1 Tax=candidate division CSSED10-310 bacterium TaxID=2855610 RepID=A0ABV6YYN1_UNCC1
MMNITMIGHSTVLIELGGKKILTDPYFGTWGNPAYKRLSPAAKGRQELTEVDFVLLSHNHWDHTDPRYFRLLSTDVPVLLPARGAFVAKLKGVKNMIKLRAWENRQFDEIRVTAVPATHIATTIGYVIECPDVVIYFAGDTFYRPFMKDIGTRFKIDLALLPVTTYRIPMTMSEKSAVKAVEDLNPKIVIPIHLALQPRSPLLRTKQTATGFRDRLAAEKIEVKTVILSEGETWTYG